MSASEYLAIRALTHQHRVFEDGTIEFLIRVPPQDSCGATARLMQTPGFPIAVVPMNHKPALYGDQAKALRLSRFFYAPEVWRHIGTDNQYQDWVRKQPSALSKSYGNESNPVVYAHVRRSAEAGTGYKPPYSGIPLLNHEHGKQHQHGEESLKPKEWWDRQRIHYVTNWAWNSLKEQLGYEHWNQVPPMVLRLWCASRDLTKYLPKEYKGVESEQG